MKDIFFNFIFIKHIDKILFFIQKLRDASIIWEALNAGGQKD